MKKKIVLFGVALAALATFNSCSNESELTQVIEEPVVKGTPFKVSAFAEGTTRATLYNANAWDGTNEDVWVEKFKLWGKQEGTSEAWLNNLVFSRTAYNATEWTPSDPNIAWPGDDEGTTDVDERTLSTTFYAITDNAIATNGAISGVTTWTPDNGTFAYSLPTTTKNIEWIDATQGNGYYSNVSTTYVDASKMTDLMVATTKKKESETTSGVLPLSFTHVLAGLAVKLIFLNDVATDMETTATIKHIKICGLKTTGTYTFGTGWPETSSLSDYTCYYKAFTETTINPQAESTASADANYIMLVDSNDPWMVIPQTTDPWDGGYLASGEEVAAGKAYIALRIEDNETGDDMELYYPLDTTFEAAHNKTLRINLGAFLEAYSRDASDPTKASVYYVESQGGGGAPAIEYIDE